MRVLTMQKLFILSLVILSSSCRVWELFPREFKVGDCYTTYKGPFPEYIHIVIESSDTHYIVCQSSDSTDTWHGCTYKEGMWIGHIDYEGRKVVCPNKDFDESRWYDYYMNNLSKVPQ